MFFVLLRFDGDRECGGVGGCSELVGRSTFESVCVCVFVTTERMSTRGAKVILTCPIAEAHCDRGDLAERLLDGAQREMVQTLD